MEQYNPSKNTRETGALGEMIAAEYLKMQGFTIIDRNYRKKWGEIDLIIKKDGVVHFVEVKSVSYETRSALEDAVTHETWRPEELVHHFKIHQITKMTDIWVEESGYTGNYQIDAIGVRYVPRETFATVNFIENVG